MNDSAQTQAAGVDEVTGRRLSFAFAKRHGVLVNRVVDGFDIGNHASAGDSLQSWSTRIATSS